MREPQTPRQTKALDTMRQVLGDEFLTLRVSQYSLTENFEDDHCLVTADVVENPGDRKFTIEGRGVGMLDSFFGALCERYQGEHPSLETIKFSSFSVRGLMGESRGDHATDAKAEAVVGITNSANTEFHFGAVSPSVSHSSIEAALEAVEYFVNSERAYVRIYKALQHYKQSGRTDLIGKYTQLMAEMVQNTSYSHAVERLKKS